jgi:hypothetical protein
MSNFNSGPSINASHQVSVHLAMRFQRRKLFKKSNFQKKNMSVADMFDNDCIEKGNFFRGHIKDACN